ncbi:MAG: LD-carboxypeptidase [Clostridia bacterium]
MQKPRRIAPGDTLGFVAASSTLADPALLPRAISAAEAMGYKVALGDSCTAKYGYLAGDDALRAGDLMRMFEREDVDAVTLIRGGYGLPRILDRLDYDLIRQSRKMVLGYSDVTGLHLALAARGLATIHGPMPTGWGEPDFAPFSRQSLLMCLNDRQMGVPLQNPEGVPVTCFHPGRAEGRLIGGNLTLMVSLLGTKYMPDLTSAILLIEDVDERLYRIDRMLTQLRLAGAFDACAGVVLGTFTRCAAEYPDRSLTYDQVIRDVVLPCNKPIISGLMIGHCQPKLTLGLGIRYFLDADRGELTPLESPFADA